MSSEVEIRTHTAIHIVKGAIQQILGAKWTSSVYSSGSNGGIAVKFDRKPTDKEIELIEINSNEIIKQNIEIKIHELTKIEAEKKWGDIIYDLFPLPSGLTNLTIFEIPGWNINTCNKKHTQKTGEIGEIRIKKSRFRANKKILEVSFEVI